jgi:hypothetical protein
MVKSDIGNFDEFVKLRNQYFEVLIKKEYGENLKEYLRETLGVFKVNCPLCTPINQECDNCMWILSEEATGIPFGNEIGSCYCCQGTYLSDELEYQAQRLDDRIKDMDQIIETYEQLEL